MSHERSPGGRIPGLRDWMGHALEQAALAREAGDVPVGAVLVCGDRLIANGYNRREHRQDPLGHAELVAISEGARCLGRWRLTGCTLFVTLEPCPMCAAALAQARVDRVVFGACDPKIGAAGTVWNLLAAPELDHRPEVLGGIREEDCRQLLDDFFRTRRKPAP